MSFVLFWTLAPIAVIPLGVWLHDRYWPVARPFFVDEEEEG